METEHVTRIERRVRRTWEWHLAGRATLGTLPAVLLVAAMAGLGGRMVQWLGIGAGLIVAAWLALYLGGRFRRAVMPGLAGGLVPLSCAVAADLYGHACSASGCVSLCVPACIGGGLGCGILISVHARRSDWQPVSLITAGWIAALAGALGCSCVGFSGIAGMAVGLVLPMAPVLWQQRLLVAR
jgi:hypothetical protein